jgi:hypothetical protein
VAGIITIAKGHDASYPCKQIGAAEPGKPTKNPGRGVGYYRALASLRQRANHATRRGKDAGPLDLAALVRQWSAHARASEAGALEPVAPAVIGTSARPQPREPAHQNRQAQAHVAPLTEPQAQRLIQEAVAAVQTAQPAWTEADLIRPNRPAVAGWPTTSTARTPRCWPAPRNTGPRTVPPRPRRPDPLRPRLRGPARPPGPRRTGQHRRPGHGPPQHPCRPGRAPRPRPGQPRHPANHRHPRRRHARSRPQALAILEDLQHPDADQIRTKLAGATDHAAGNPST